MNNPATSDAGDQAVKRFLELIAKRFNVESTIIYKPDGFVVHKTIIAVILQGRRKSVMSCAAIMANMAYDVFVETGVELSTIPAWHGEWDRLDAYEEPLSLRKMVSHGVWQWRKLSASWTRWHHQITEILSRKGAP